MLLDKLADGTGEKHHDTDGNNHRNDHERYFRYNTDGGKDRVKGKNDVEQNDLNNGSRQGYAFCFTLTVFLFFVTFHFMIDFHGAFCD